MPQTISITPYGRLRRQVELLCIESYAEYDRAFPDDPFDSWFRIAPDGKTICRNKKKYDYCMSVALEALLKGTCEEMVDVLYYISNETPEVTYDD